MADKVKCPNCGSTKLNDELTTDDAYVCDKCSVAYSAEEASGELMLLRTKGDHGAAQVPAFDPAHDVELDPGTQKLIEADADQPEA